MRELFQISVVICCSGSSVWSSKTSQRYSTCDFAVCLPCTQCHISNDNILENYRLKDVYNQCYTPIKPRKSPAHSMYEGCYYLWKSMVHCAWWLDCDFWMSQNRQWIPWVANMENRRPERRIYTDGRNWIPRNPIPVNHDKQVDWIIRCLHYKIKIKYGCPIRRSETGSPGSDLGTSRGGDCRVII